MTDIKKNILIYRLGSLGDTVIALPCFHQIKKSFPDSHITLLTNKPVMSKAAPLEAVLGTNNFFHNILSYPVGTRNPAVLLQLNREIRALNIDTVVNITALRSSKSDRRDKLFFQLAGVTNFIGFDHEESDYKVSIDPSTGFYEWETHRLLKKIVSLGPVDLEDNDYWDLFLSNQELERANEVLGAFKFDDFIVVNAGTKMEVKDWGQKKWSELIEQLSLNHPNEKLVIIGVQEEFNFGEELLGGWKGLGLNLCGKTSPRESAAVLKKAKLFIGHDSGPMHLAACVGTPCVGIFSCINRPKQWFPRGEAHRIIMPKTACASNDVKGCIHPNNYCVHSITSNEVLSEVNILIEQISIV